MLTGKTKRCMRCMSPLTEGEICSYCGCDNKVTKTPPYCLKTGTCLNHRYYTGLVLGEGGFGITYIGWDQTLSISVAIKEYYPKGMIRRTVIQNYGDGAYCYDDSFMQEPYQKGMKAFMQEARNLAGFHQLDGVAVVRDYFMENDTAYIVMDYIQGSSIEKYIKEHGRLPADQVIKMLRPVMDTLQIMHVNHMIHRDVSGDNLLVTPKGTVKLVDFGSARRMADQDHTMTVMYKRGYAPEEQYRSKGEAGPWTDIYSICVVMYYMISGVMPEEATQRLMADQTVPLFHMDGVEITREQSDAIEKGMSVLAADRFKSMSELLKALGETTMEAKELQQYILPEARGTKADAKKTSMTEKERESEHAEITTEMLYRELVSGEESCPRPHKRSVIRVAVILAVGILLAAGWELYTQTDRQKKTPSTQPVVQTTAAAGSTWLTAEPVTTPAVPQETPDAGEMPKVVGLSAQKAHKKLQKAGFYKIKQKYKELVNGKNGRVLAQNISAGKRIRFQKQIVLTICRRKEPETTPKPTGESTIRKSGQPANKDNSTEKTQKKDKKNVVGSLDALLDE